jgi:hypothetical protein
MWPMLHQPETVGSRRLCDISPVHATATNSITNIPHHRQQEQQPDRLLACSHSHCATTHWCLTHNTC